jgi:polyisoprenoid-binding protein YceI
MWYRCFSVLPVVFLFLGCFSDIDEKPAAEVTETSATALQTSTTQPTSVGEVIKEKSAIGFIGAKVTGQHVGKFHEFNGRVEYVGTTPTGIDFTINPASLKTDEAKLDTHLKSADFFDVARYPTATFVSKSVRPAEPGNPDGTHRISGTLTMHGVSKEVTFPARVEVTPQGVHATSDFKINRHDWGISYRGAPDNLIKDDVAIRLDLWFPPPPTA